MKTQDKPYFLHKQKKLCAARVVPSIHFYNYQGYNNLITGGFPLTVIYGHSDDSNEKICNLFPSPGICADMYWKRKLEITRANYYTNLSLSTRKTLVALFRENLRL